MNRFAKMKKERIYTLFETLSVSNEIGILESEVVKGIKENIL